MDSTLGAVGTFLLGWNAFDTTGGAGAVVLLAVPTGGTFGANGEFGANGASLGFCRCENQISRNARNTVGSVAIN